MEKDELSLLIQHVVKSNSAKLTRLAKVAGKRCSTLLRESDPNNARAKMGVETLLAIMEASEDVSPLDYMARTLGLRLVKLTQRENAEKE